MEKIKQYKYIILITLAILEFAFFWFQVRPLTIKKSCSWFAYVIPVDAGVTKEQADTNKKALEQCRLQLAPEKGIKPFWYPGNTEERLPTSERKAGREATKSEYDLCLRRHGLK